MPAARKKPAPRARAERLEARVTAEQKALFERAADLSGRSLTDFVVTAVQEAANAEIERQKVTRLSREESIAFVEAILNPPEPNEALRRAHERYLAATADRRAGG